MVEELEISSPIANSDHNVIMFKMVCKTIMDRNDTIVFNYHHGDYTKICGELLEVNWVSNFDNSRVEVMWGEFVEKLLECRRKYVPEREIKEKGYPRWMKPSIINKIKKRNKALKRFDV